MLEMYSQSTSNQTYPFLVDSSIQLRMYGTRRPPSKICVGWYTNNGIVIRDKLGESANMILMIGIPENNSDQNPHDSFPVKTGRGRQNLYKNSCS